MRIDSKDTGPELRNPEKEYCQSAIMGDQLAGRGLVEREGEKKQIRNNSFSASISLGSDYRAC